MKAVEDYLKMKDILPSSYFHVLFPKTFPKRITYIKVKKSKQQSGNEESRLRKICSILHVDEK